MGRKNRVQYLGMVLAMLGGAVLAGIFLIVLVNGTWPAFLHPIRQRFGIVSAFVGDWAFIVEVWIFIGPGMLIYWLGGVLEDRATRKGRSKNQI